MGVKWWRNRQTQDAVLSLLYESIQLIIFDTETTGFNPKKGDQIIELAAKKYEIGRGIHLECVDQLHFYIKPDFLIRPKITEVTGITNDFLADKPSAHEVFGQIKSFFDDAPVGGYNVDFDCGFMSALYQQFGSEFRPQKTVDILEMARDVVDEEDVDNFKLQTIAALYGVDKGITFHSALDDTEVTFRLFEIISAEYERRFLEEFKEKQAGKDVKVQSVSYWQSPYNGKLKRIYVETDQGSVFYDLFSKKWRPKDADIASLNMDSVEKQALKMALTSDISAFAKFKGKVTA